MSRIQSLVAFENVRNTDWNDRFVEFIHQLGKWEKTAKKRTASTLKKTGMEMQCIFMMQLSKLIRQTMYKLTPSQIQFPDLEQKKGNWKKNRAEND